jgi:hypothetical protein
MDNNPQGHITLLAPAISPKLNCGQPIYPHTAPGAILTEQLIMVLLILRKRRMEHPTSQPTIPTVIHRIRPKPKNHLYETRTELELQPENNIAIHPRVQLLSQGRKGGLHRRVIV